MLEAAARQNVSHFVYASTAVVYGKPSRVPVDEDHPLNVLAARKPAYGVAKEFAEKLVLLAGQAGMSSTIVRFWWAFGDEIGGRHLREMLRTSAEGKPLAVPADCGGSFLSQGDFNLAGGNDSPAAGGGRQGLQPRQRLCRPGKTWPEWSWRSHGDEVGSK